MILPLMIGGNLTSGKGVLAALLEGHPQIFSIPMWHDQIATLLFRARHTLQLDCKDNLVFSALESLKDFSAFSLLELASHAGVMKFPVSATHFESLLLPINYAQFRVDLITSLKNTINTDVSSIFSIIMKNLAVQFVKSTDYLPVWGVSHLSPGSFDYNAMSSFYPNGKFLFMKRDINDSFASYIFRLHRGNNVEKGIHTFFSNNFSKSYIENVIDAETFALKNKSKMLIIDFNSLILNTKETMIRVCDFLQLPYDKILETPTFMKKQISKSAIGKINDTAKSLLSLKEQEILNTYIGYFHMQAMRETQKRAS